MSISRRDKKAVIYGEVERLRHLLDARDREIERLKARPSAPAPRPRGQLAAKWDARRAAALRYFEANPGANSVTAQDLVAFLEKTA